MFSLLASPGESSTSQQVRDAGVPPAPAHVGPNAAAAVVGLPEEITGQQDPDSSSRRTSRRLIDFMGGQNEEREDQLSPDDSSGGRPSVQQRRPDLPSNNSGSLPPSQGRPREPAGHWFSWPVLVGFSILTFNSFMATYRSWGDTGDISFVVSTYFTLLSLFFSIKKFQAATPPKREGLKVCVWIFTMALTFGFVYQIIGTTAKPTLHLTLLLWAMPAATGASVFIIFRDRSGAPLGEELPDV